VVMTVWRERQTLGTPRWDIEQLCGAVDSLGGVDFAILFGFGSEGGRRSLGMLVVGSVSPRELHEALQARAVECLVESNRLVMTAPEFWRRCGSGDPYLSELLRHGERHVHPAEASGLVEAASLAIPNLADAKPSPGIAPGAGITRPRQELILAATAKRIVRGD